MKTLLPTLFVILATTFCLAWAQETPTHAEQPQTDAETDAEQPQTFNFWMDAKLHDSQAIFAALAQADFPAIVESTDRLKGLTKIERFVRRRSPEYRTQLRSFEFAVKEMDRQARAENLEGVVLGFHQMTLSCVNCHNQLRSHQEQEAAHDNGS